MDGHARGRNYFGWGLGTEVGCGFAVESERRKVRITQTVHDALAAHSTNVLRTRTYAWLTDGSDTATLVSTHERAVEGFKTWSDTAAAASSSVRTLPSAGSWTDTHTAPDGSYSIALYQNARVTSVTRYDSLNNQLSTLNFSYDSHGRRTTTTDARTGTTTFSFNHADQVVSTTTPPPGTGASAQTTTAHLDSLGRATNTVQPDGTSVQNAFSLRGEPVRSSGARTYPAGYSYEPQGRMKTMTNWSAYPSTGARVTTWYYDALRGWLTNKVYADGKGTKYSYTGAGRPATRLWARGTNTTYSYNDFGDLSGVSYNDGATPAIGYTFTRRGQHDKITRGSDSWRLFYTTAGQLLSEAGTAGTLNGLRVTNAFDEFLRRTNLSSANGATLLTTNGYTFDAGGRLSTARDGTFVATYSYLANSPLVGQIQFKSNSFVSLTTTKTHDNLNRLQRISSQPGASGVAPIAFDYAYNDANQRTRVNLADGSFWIYEYDSLGQVKSAKRYWSDWTPVAGQQHEYNFDDIGNRTSTKTGGDSTSANLRLASYTNNTLNQITARDVPAYLNVIGAATATATNVNVNNFMAYRRSEYYHVELNTPNTSAAVWQSVTNRAVRSGTTNSVTGNLFLPKHAEVFSYDADGNLTNDGRWAYVWDGENRLVRQFAPTTGPSGSVKALTYGYDWQHRRISKTVSNYSGGAWSKVLDEKYLYDAWNQLASLNASNNAVVRAFLWGTDLSGTLQGAGGGGGLVSMTVHSGTYAGTYFYAYDGNGNVAALINAADNSVSSRYEYGPFHELLRATGPLAFINPFRASTKFQDDETGFLYYGYRYCDPTTGRWLSRDPLGEMDSEYGHSDEDSDWSVEIVLIINLYSFGSNSPLDGFDTDGQRWGKLIRDLIEKFLKPKPTPPPKPPTPPPQKPPPNSPPKQPPQKRDPSKPDSKRRCVLIRAHAPGSTLNPRCKSCWKCAYQCSGTGIVGGGGAIHRFQIGGCVKLTGFVPGFFDEVACEAAANAGKKENPYE